MIKMICVGAVAIFAVCLYALGMVLEMAVVVEEEKRSGKRNRRG